MEKKQKIFISVIAVLVLGVAGLAMLRGPSAPPGPGKYDAFASCLEEKGAVFYGAFWCPHCQTQKKLFGSSQRFIPYVECSTPNGQGQTLACIEKGITNYPTWEFADGSRVTGEIPLAELAEKTSCELPE